MDALKIPSPVYGALRALRKGSSPPEYTGAVSAVSYDLDAIATATMAPDLGALSRALRAALPEVASSRAENAAAPVAPTATGQAD